jgi:hypothetical protein
MDYFILKNNNFDSNVNFIYAIKIIKDITNPKFKRIYKYYRGVEI